MKCKVLRLDLTLFRQSVSSQFPPWRTLGSLSLDTLCVVRKSRMWRAGGGINFKIR